MMKHIIILGDGMGWKLARKVFGRKDLVQAPKHPIWIISPEWGAWAAQRDCCRRFSIGQRRQRGMSVLGYNLPKVYEGRGPRWASIGVDLKPGEMAMRCNIICIEGDDIKEPFSRTHITTEEADVLVKYLQEHLGDERALSIQVCNTVTCWS